MTAKTFEGVLKLRDTDVPTVTRDVPVKELMFYPDNPRIYSLVVVDGKKPDQAEILERLLKLEHVRALVQDIRANGGLIDPMIVRDGDMVVLEGNSRLAAYRHLVNEDPNRWASARCTILPESIDEKLVFALLAQYHVKGKKDWAPFEKAGFIYRRFKDQKIDLKVAAPELGVTFGEAQHLIAVYEFMLLKNDSNPSRWSYYDELLKSRKIAQARKTIAGFEDFIVNEIKSEALGKAMDLRDKLPVICAAQPKILKRYMAGEYDFAEAHEHAVAQGGEHHVLAKLRRFRKWLNSENTADDALEAPKQIRDAIHYELKEIEKKAGKIKQMVDKKKAEIA